MIKTLSLGDVLAVIKCQFYMPICRVSIRNNMLTTYLLTMFHNFSVYLISRTSSTIWNFSRNLKGKFINVHVTMGVHWPGRPNRTILGQVGPGGGQSAPLWHQLSRSLTFTLARRRQRAHQLHNVGLDKIHGQPATWCPPGRPLSWKHCRQAYEPPLGHYKYTPYAPHCNTHTL
jgi:hypothetical protein